MTHKNLSWIVLSALFLTVHCGENSVETEDQIRGNDTTRNLNVDDYSDSVISESTMEMGSANCRINSFTARPSTIASGNSSTLSWSTSNCDRVVINDGVTDTEYPVNGSTEVFPTATTKYTLEAIFEIDGVKFSFLTVTVKHNLTVYMQGEGTNCNTFPKHFDILVDDQNEYDGITTDFIVPYLYNTGQSWSVEMTRTIYRVKATQQCQEPFNTFTCLLSKSVGYFGYGHKRIAGKFEDQNVVVAIECIGHHY